MKLTPNEVKLVIYSLRSTISQFSSKQDWNPEDWPKVRLEQRNTRKLLMKLESGRT